MYMHQHYGTPRSHSSANLPVNVSKKNYHLRRDCWDVNKNIVSFQRYLTAPLLITQLVVLSGFPQKLTGKVRGGWGSAPGENFHISWMIKQCPGCSKPRAALKSGDEPYSFTGQVLLTPARLHKPNATL